MDSKEFRSWCIGRLGGAGGIRTPDLLDAIEARCQLRYGPTVDVFLNGLQVQPAPDL